MSKKVKMSSSSSIAGIETFASLVNTIIDNYSRSHINQMLPQIIHILCFCLIDMLPQIL